MADAGIVATVEKDLAAVNYATGKGLDEVVLGKKAADFIDRPTNEVAGDIAKAALAEIKELGAKFGIGGGEAASAAAAPAARATGKGAGGREV
jgi:hypothetical protein